MGIFGGYVIRVFACLAPLLSNFYAASEHLSFSVLCVHLPSCWSCSNSRVRRWRTSSLGWVIRRLHTPLWYRSWVGSLSFSFFFPLCFWVFASLYAVEFWSEGQIKWRPLLQQLGCKRGLWEITTPLCCRRRGGTLLWSGEVWMVIVVLTFVHAEFVTDFPPNSQGISSHSFP